MTSKKEYLGQHQRTICKGCRHWVLWYLNKKGKKVFGCEIGKIPYRDECTARKGKRSRRGTPVI